jgi:hypothetical protein
LILIDVTYLMADSPCISALFCNAALEIGDAQVESAQSINDCHH